MNVSRTLELTPVVEAIVPGPSHFVFEPNTSIALVGGGATRTGWSRRTGPDFGRISAPLSPLARAMVARAYSHLRDIRDNLFSWKACLCFSQPLISSCFVTLPHHYADIVSRLCVASQRLGPGGMHWAGDGVLIREALHDF